MPGILDNDPSLYGGSVYGGLLSQPSVAFPAVQTPEDKAKALWDQIEADNAKENATSDKRKTVAQANLIKQTPVLTPQNQLTAPDAANPAVSYALGNQPDPYGNAKFSGAPFSLSPPQAALPPAVADSNASSVPVPQPRPAAAPAPAPAAPLDITPSVASANAATPAVPPSAVPESSLMGRIGQGIKDFDSHVSNHTATLLAAAGGLAGAPSWGTGLSRGFTQAAAALPIDQKLTNQNQTVQALIKRGMPEDMARAAAGNPVIMQQIVPQMFGAKQRKFTQIGEDMTGNKTFGFVDEAAGKTYDMGGNQIQPGQAGSMGIPSDANGQPLQGPALMAHLEKTSPAVAAEVKAMISGDASTTLRNVQKLAPVAHLVDPTFSESMYPTRVAMRKDFAGEGKNGQSIASFNTAQHHIDKLSDDLESLAKHNGDFPSLNHARAWLANNANTNPKMRDSLQAVNDDMAAVSHEVGNAYNSGHLSDHDMSTWQKLTNSDLPPDQLRRGISDFVDLLNGKRDSLNHMYRQTFGADAPTIDKEKNEAITSKVHQRLANGGDKAASGPSKVSTKAEYDALPKGAPYTAPDGTVRAKP